MGAYATALMHSVHAQHSLGSCLLPLDDDRLLCLTQPSHVYFTLLTHTAWTPVNVLPCLSVWIVPFLCWPLLSSDACAQHVCGCPICLLCRLWSWMSVRCAV